MRLRILSTIIGVMAGVASLVACFNFSATARREILRDIQNLSPNLIFFRSTAAPTTSNDQQSGFEIDEVKTIQREIPEIRGISPVIQDRSFYPTPDGPTRYRRMLVLGVWPEFPQVLEITIARGRFFAPLEQEEGKRVCVLSAEAAERLFPDGVEPGDNVRLYNAEFLVVGIASDIEPCPFFRVKGSVLIPQATLTALKERDDLPQLIGLRLTPNTPQDLIVQRIESILMRQRELPTFESWEQSAYIETQKRVVRTIEWLLSSIAFLTLLTACIGCMNIMVVSVNERTREIGLRMAVGATQFQILRMFLLEGFRIMAAGGVLGVIGGYFLTDRILKPLPQLITGYQGWTFTFTGEAVWKAVGVLALCAFLASLLPAWRAASLDPSRALRSE
ncbi:MAG: ABC transporter permease [Candidatus Sumerlaeia bacterium]